MLFISPVFGEESRPRLGLVPFPQKVDFADGSFVPEKRLILRADKVETMAATCVRDFSALGFDVGVGKVGEEDSGSVVQLRLETNSGLGDEGYRLTIDSKVSIVAATEDGLFWGTRTLLQLLQAGPGTSVPRVTITDQPEFGYRGLMIDNARQFHSIDFHLATIKRLASFKVNRYQIHFSDAQSYTLPSEAFPDLPTPDRHYTKEEVETLVSVAAEYHVMIVPEIDVPGHSSALSRGIRGLGCSNVPDGKAARKLCIGKESTYETLETLFSEVMDMIPGDYWHLGADEVRYDGRSCTDCAKRMDQEGFTEGVQLFHTFINRMHDLVKPSGRQMLVWEGFSPVTKPLVTKEIIVCPFDIKHAGHMPKDYFNAGYTVLNTSWTPLYIADKLYVTTPEILARWSPYMFGAGRSPQPFTYWKKFKPEDYQGKVIGAQMCSWANEEKAEEGLLFGTGRGFSNYGRPGPRVQIMAERVWTGSETSVESILGRVDAHYWPK